MNGTSTSIRRNLKERSRLLRRRPTGTAKFKRKQQAEVFLLLADLLTVGFSLRHALSFVKTVNPSLQEVVGRVDQQMQLGNSFAQSLRLLVKDDLYYQLLLAEQHGNLTKTLQEIGQLLTAQQEQKKKLWGLLQYPLILLGMLVVVLTALIWFVFPELQTWEANSQPARLIYWSGLVASFGVGALLVAGGFQWDHWRRMNREQRVNWLCRLPIVGKCYCYYYCYYFTSILGTMLSRGMSLATICKLTQNFNKHSLLYLFSQKAQRFSQEGRDFTALISQYPFLPNELIVFINKGATLEQVGDDLTAFAQLQFKTLTSKIERLLIYVQPLVFALIAVVIVSLYLSILLPIYHSFQGVY